MVTPLRIQAVMKDDDPVVDTVGGPVSGLLGQRGFLRMLALERKRSERSNGIFILMLLEMEDQETAVCCTSVLHDAAASLQSIIRETDLMGWYKEETSLGAIFTGITSDTRQTALSTIWRRVSGRLSKTISQEDQNKIRLSFYTFPDEWKQDEGSDAERQALYPDLYSEVQSKKGILRVKRIIDIVGAALFVLIGWPLYVVIGLAIKLSSPGPILYRQERVGQYGQRFTFLKFRSMHVGNDDTVHQAYIKQLIAGEAERVLLKGRDGAVYKLANDKRITRVGKILRKTSLDELPQFFNVLRGDMSLVGPRPAIPYELSAYQTWHRRRLLEVKPGITGLWQIAGRSRVTFDEMVRMDLRYASTWSPWMDIMILLRTPAAVFKGAY